MSDLPNSETLVEIGLQTIVGTPGTRLTEAAARREGSDLDVILHVGGAMGEEVVRQLGTVAAGLLLDTAEDEALDRLVFDLPFPVERKKATGAFVSVRFTRPTALKGPGTIEAGYKVSLGGSSFRTLFPTPVAVGVLTVVADAQCEKTGPEGNVPTGPVGKLVGTLWDTTFVPSADGPGAGGSDAETNESLRSRARTAHETARKGTLAAIENGALTVPGVAHAAAYEFLEPDGTPARAVELIVSDGAGNSNAALQAAVLAVMPEYRAGGIPVVVSGGIPVLEDVILVLTFATGIDTQAAFAAASARIVASINALGPGQTLVREARIVEPALAGGSTVTGIVGLKVIEPAGDVVPPTQQTVIRTSSALVSLQV